MEYSVRGRNTYDKNYLQRYTWKLGGRSITDLGRYHGPKFSYPRRDTEKL